MVCVKLLLNINRKLVQVTSYDVLCSTSFSTSAEYFDISYSIGDCFIAKEKRMSYINFLKNMVEINTFETRNLFT